MSQFLIGHSSLLLIIKKISCLDFIIEKSTINTLGFSVASFGVHEIRNA